MTDLVLAHDYITQRGGAERVVLNLAHRFSPSRILTALYNPATTFPDFADLPVSTGALNKVPLFRNDPRLALPLLSSAWSAMEPVSADVVLCSSSGWSHGVPVAPGTRKVVYCYNPPRWLYQTDDYLMGMGVSARAALHALAPGLRRWDQRAAATADVYIAISTSVAKRIEQTYGRPAKVIFPPVVVDATGPQQAVEGLEPGYFLTIGRKRGYKGTHLLVDAFANMPDRRLVIVGSAQTEETPANITYTGFVSDSELSWLYANARALISVSREDFGLTPIEANAFGTPSLLIRAGGFLDTTDEGVSGRFIETADREGIMQAVEAFPDDWDGERIRAHAAKFDSASFAKNLSEHLGV